MCDLCLRRVTQLAPLMLRNDIRPTEYILFSKRDIRCLKVKYDGVLALCFNAYKLLPNAVRVGVRILLQRFKCKDDIIRRKRNAICPLCLVLQLNGQCLTTVAKSERFTEQIELLACRIVKVEHGLVNVAKRSINTVCSRKWVEVVSEATCDIGSHRQDSVTCAGRPL